MENPGNNMQGHTGTHNPGSHGHGGPDGPGNGHHHHKHDLPYYDPDYDSPMQFMHPAPDSLRFPDQHIFGQYATLTPPAFVPHPPEHTAFKPRKADFLAPFTCEEPPADLCIRKDHRSLTVDEQNRFLNAFMMIKFSHILGPLVDIHANTVHMMHSNPRFLPWHRIYLLRFEELLMAVDPTVCVPYWKSSEDQTFPTWLLNFTPTVELMNGPHTVTRNIGVGARLPNAADLAVAMSNPTFNSFAAALEGIHNSGHVWVGGSMQSIPTAPCDPIFWMHHAELDRIWSVWEAAHPGQYPPLTDAAAIMDPWSETEVDTRDIEALGYQYA